MKQQRRAALIRNKGRRYVDAVDVAEAVVNPVTREFDNIDDEEIAAISAEIGATGARRPASE
jgi:DNA-binding protein